MECLNNAKPTIGLLRRPAMSTLDRLVLHSGFMMDKTNAFSNVSDEQSYIHAYASTRTHTHSHFFQSNIHLPRKKNDTSTCRLKWVALYRYVATINIHIYCMLNRNTYPEEQRDARCGIKFTEHLLRIRIVQRRDYYFSTPVLAPFSGLCEKRTFYRTESVTNDKYKDLIYFLSSL